MYVCGCVRWGGRAEGDKELEEGGELGRESLRVERECVYICLGLCASTAREG